MLNISENSWHYPVVLTFRESPPKSLCSYFWSFLGTFLLAIAIGGCVGAVGALWLGAMLDPVLTYLLPWILDVPATHTFLGNGNPITWASWGPTYFTMAINLFVGTLVLLETDSYKRWKRNRAIKKDQYWGAIERAEGLSAFQVLLKGALAIKNKVCPRINYLK